MNSLHAWLLLALLGSSTLQAAPRTLDWADLLPEGASAPLPPLAALHELARLDGLLDEENGPPVPQQTDHAPLVEALDGQHIRLPGYLVPLYLGRDGRVREFLLAPYLGACIHVPPPPPNQLVLVRSAAGVPIGELHRPYWIEGVLQVSRENTALAEAGYRMEQAQLVPYEE